MQTKIKFYKYEGTGNDFILIDGRNQNVSLLNNAKINGLCDRRFGIGADGLIILKPSTNYDFEMEFYNSDGNLGTMCGNGGRCIVAFAKFLGIINKETTFLAPDGEHYAVAEDADFISLKMADVTEIQHHELGLFIDTGSPHLLIFSNIDDNKKAYAEGYKIRYSSLYAKQGGVNVNFIKQQENNISLITYERGVEDITYSCGTGSVATAIAVNVRFNKQSPILVDNIGGGLEVSFTKEQQHYTNIWLKGSAKQTFEGEFMLSEKKIIK